MLRVLDEDTYEHDKLMHPNLLLLQDSGSRVSSQVVESSMWNGLWSVIGVVLNISSDETVVIR